MDNPVNGGAIDQEGSVFVLARGSVSENRLARRVFHASSTIPVRRDNRDAAGGECETQLGLEIEMGDVPFGMPRRHLSSKPTMCQFRNEMGDVQSGGGHTPAIGSDVGCITG